MSGDVRSFWLAVLAGSLYARGSDSLALGAVSLDNRTFDKFLSVPGYSFLVKFDRSSASGVREDQFKELCKMSATAPQFFVGVVGIEEGDEKTNADLATRFKLSLVDYPAYILFNEANPISNLGLRYRGFTEASDVAAWLRKNKVRISSAGTIVEFDEIVSKFMTSGFAEEHLETARTLSEAYSSDRKAGMYVKIMGKIKAKGREYVASELERIKILQQGKITATKQSELVDKVKVLNIFAEVTA